MLLKCEDRLLRTIEIDGVPWLNAPDVCRIIGISNTTMALRPLDPDQRALKTFEGRPHNFISESGFYSIAMRAPGPAITTSSSTATSGPKWIGYPLA